MGGADDVQVAALVGNVGIPFCEGHAPGRARQHVSADLGQVSRIRDTYHAQAICNNIGVTPHYGHAVGSPWHGKRTDSCQVGRVGYVDDLQSVLPSVTVGRSDVGIRS